MLKSVTINGQAHGGWRLELVVLAVGVMAVAG